MTDKHNTTPTIPGWHRWIGWVIALIPLSLFGFFASQLPAVSSGTILTPSLPWAPSLNINLDFRLDGLSLLMTLIITGIGTFIMIYGGGYLRGDRQLNRFYPTILLFMFAMLGVVLSDNIFLLFISWELTSITSYILIGYKHNDESSRDAAWQALLVTGGGGLAMMAGLVLLANIGGSTVFTDLFAAHDTIVASPLYLPALLLILLGAFTKSAQFPFHFWLPNAMAAPTPVSAYLHSATMVKAGVYLLARLSPVLGHTDAWFWTVTLAGVVTMLVSAWLSWQQRDLKRILAYSTVTALGTLVMLIGLGTKLAAETAVVFLLVHALYKGGLFMAAGAIDHETGTRDVEKLGHLARTMPITLAAVLLGTISMAGLPPLLGFISKELMYESTLALQPGIWAAVLTTAAVLTNVLMVAAAAIVAIRPFFQPPADPHLHSHEAPPSMWLGPVILGALALLTGLLPGWSLDGLMGAAAGNVYGSDIELHLAIWHGFTPYLLLSVVTITAGALFYWQHQRLLAGSVQLDTAVSRYGPQQWYRWSLDGVVTFAGWLTARIQNGYLRRYLIYVISTLIILVTLPLLLRDVGDWTLTLTRVRPYELTISLLIIGGVYMVVQAKSRLVAIAGLGVVGFGIAVLYILFGAPDLAMTQFSVETLTVILFVLVLYRLPKFETLSPRRARIRDAILAVMGGTLMAVIVLLAKNVPHDTHVADYYAAFSYLEAKGRNVVNVILVDFRGLDTMIEITVLSVAALGVYSLLKASPKEEVNDDQQANYGDGA